MAGLMNARMQQGEEQAPPMDETTAAPSRSGGGLMPAGREQQPQAAALEGEEAANVSPEEQAQYDQFVGNAYELIYEKERLPTILRTLQGDGNPAEGLASTALSVVQALRTSAEKNGAELSPDVMMHGGEAIVEDLATLQAEAGIADLSEDEVTGAFYRALDMFREAEQEKGNLDPAKFQQDMAALQQAEQQGQLGQALGVGEGM